MSAFLFYTLQSWPCSWGSAPLWRLAISAGNWPRIRPNLALHFVLLKRRKTRNSRNFSLQSVLLGWISDLRLAGFGGCGQLFDEGFHKLAMTLFEFFKDDSHAHTRIRGFHMP